MRRLYKVLAVICLFAAQVAVGSTAPLKQVSVGTPRVRYEADQILVKIAPVQSSKSSARAAGASAAISIKNVVSAVPQLAGARVERSLNVPGWAVVRLPKGLSVEQAVGLFKQRGEISRVEPNYKVYTLAVPTPNDSYYSLDYHDSSFPEITWPYMWNMQKIEAKEGWDIYPNRYFTAGTKPSNSIHIAVIDSGIDPDHPDFINAGGFSTDSASGGQIDWADGCSIFDGVMTMGADAFFDESGHGTHVSGIAAAAGNNATGVIGVGYNAQIVPIRVVSADGTGNDSDLAQAIRYAADKGFPVINISLGSTDYSDLLSEAVNYAYYKGCLIVAAANESGSGGGDLGKMYPAACSKVLAVSPTGMLDDFPSGTAAEGGYAGYGDYIGISAPSGSMVYFPVDFSGDGDFIDFPQFTPTWSCAPTYPVGITDDQLGNPFVNYGALLGTSMATPHVSGLAALYAEYKGYTANTPGGNLAIWRAIQRGADNAQGAANGGYDFRYGFGRINVRQSLLDVNTRNATVGSVSGQVFYRGTPAQSASIKVQPMAGGTIKQTNSQANGLWRLPNIQPGIYKVTAVYYGETKEFHYVEVVAGADTPGLDSWIGDTSYQPDSTVPELPSVTVTGYTVGSSTLHASWWARDTESGILRYDAAVGTTPGAQDVVPWTDMGWRTACDFDVSAAGGKQCYVSVRATNGAGLLSSVASPLSISGQITLGNYIGDVTKLPITVELRKQGGSTTTLTIYLDASGKYKIDNVLPGTYDIAIKASHWLRKVVSGVRVGI